ncbi:MULTISPECIES: LysE/ArgO family amino acid transporter [Kocuria]|uniref:LysE/ArgO family amino acid transporter n=1 Tax=Kocuria TaxID=57493 RepID=UPI0007E96CB2|nr:MULTISPECIES: LysE/ArgO family amino acid transporter [Kocuria]MCT1722447.1 LysE/ArgO family amino acid transporter [Kocuria marina]MCT1734809.1 LysE/ArgO family amino acid transporter [Kocuria marina]MCT2362176.1 LysE/ArgO family amino acid transporter [Kocuria marina]OBA46562.1 amino acid transporter [Kocuria sp. ICS0012]
MTSAFLPGLVTGLALIVAIGAQNAFVLRQGIRREHLGVVVGICIVSDIFLIGLGTAGIGFLIDRVPWLLNLFRWAGVVYLLVFAVTSFRSALKPQAMDVSGDDAGSLRRVVLATLAFTWLNPHAYLDAVLILGNLANQHGEQRWIFAGGAFAGSVIWFTALGAGARALSHVLNTPLTWRIVDALVGVVMVFIAIQLALMPAV